MRTDYQNRKCDPQLLRGYLERELTSREEAALEAHLDDCPSCRERICDCAAEPDCWADASRYLRPDAWDEEARGTRMGSPRSFADSLGGGQDEIVVRQLKDWLDPTDDPKYIGRFGGYEILGVVGFGGMGVVLKGFESSLNRYVAIKVLSPALATSGAARRRFARKAQAAAAVLHENVIAIHRVDESHGLPYLVMPFVSGVSLQHRIDDGPLPLTTILRIGRQIAAGLAAAHAQGLVHRDIKPANILLERGVDRVTITDFGLARAADDGSLTKTGAIAGTPQYMSPEQARGEPIDCRSDLFSLGSVMYAMAAGRPPFRAETGYGTLRCITDGEPPSLREINPEIPEWFEAIIRRLHAKNLEERFQSAEELAELLEDCLAHVQQPTRVPLPAELPKAAVPKTRSFVPRNLGVLAMFGAIAIGLLGLMGLAAEPPEIAGAWSGEGWGRVALKKTGDRQYSGTYTDTVGGQPGEIELRWSPIERRYHGTWREGEDRFGEISVRLVRDEIRGAWTVDRGSRINPATPRLADLEWHRAKPQVEAGNDTSGFTHRVPFEIGATLLRGGDRITIDEVRGTADTMKAGGIYEIRGTYRLASREKAVLAALVTDDGTDPPANKLPDFPMQETQSLTVGRGEGRFALVLYMWHAGKPHVSFYPESGEGFGHVYFGTGDSVLKTAWWEAADRDDDLDRLSLEHAAKRFNARTAEERRELFDPPIPDLTVERLREGFRASAKLYRQRAKQQVADALEKIAETGRLPEEASGGLIGSGAHAKDENGQTVSRQIVPALVLPDDSVGSGRSLVVLRPLELIYRKDGPVSKDYGDLFQMDAKRGADDNEPSFLDSYSTGASGNRVTIACTPDCKRVAIAGGDPTRILQADGTSRVEGTWRPTAEILDTARGKTVASLKLSTAEEDTAIAATPRVSHFEATAMAFSPDGKLLAVGTSVGQVKLFDGHSGALVRAFDDEQARRADGETPESWKPLRRAMGSVRSLAFSPDGNRLVMCGDSFAEFADVFDVIESLARSRVEPGRLKVWDVATGEFLHDLDGHLHVEAAAFSPDGNWLASVGRWALGGTGVLIWNAESWELERKITIKANGGTHAVAFSPDGKRIAIGSRHFDNGNDTSTTTIQLAQAQSGVMLWQRMLPGYANPKTFTPDGESVLVLCGGESIQLLAADNGELRHEIRPVAFLGAQRWTDFAVAGRADRLAIGGVDDVQSGIAEVWNLAGAEDGISGDGRSGAPQPTSARKAAGDQSAAAAPTFDISGVVLSTDRQPLADADVRLLETYTHSEELHARARTDREGRFAFHGIPQDKQGQWRYTLAVSAPAFASRVVFVPYAPRETVRFELELSAPAALRGRVVDADGHPVAGATVWTPPLKQFIPGMHSATTDASGYFQIADLAAWDSAEEEAARKAAGNEGWSGVQYALRVHHRDHGRKLAYYARVPTSLYIRFDPPMRVSGQVFDRRSGFPVAGATVRAGSVAAMTDAGGRYQFTVQPLEDLSVQAELGEAKSQSIALKGLPGAAVRLADLQLGGANRRVERTPEPGPGDNRTGGTDSTEDSAANPS